MNMLIVSPGRRVELVEYFKYMLNSHGRKLYTLDMSSMSSALYFADEYFIIEKDFNHLSNYIDKIIEICQERDIKVVMTLIDPELILFREYEQRFTNHNISLLMSNKKLNQVTFDKYEFYNVYKNTLPLQKTFHSKLEILKEIDTLGFPLIVKDRYGSGSNGIFVLNDMNALKQFTDDGKMIFQEKFTNFEEYSVHLYFDYITGKLIDLFMSKSLSMRGGESDKAVSVWKEQIYEVLKNLEGFKGTINVDIFINNGQIYINEINPRFGGSYNHAHNCGCDCVAYTINNILGYKNVSIESFPSYKVGIYMLKYNGFYFGNINKEYS